MDRRLFLSLIGGLSIPSLLQAQYGKDSKAKNIIYVFLPGGISAQETFDPKPLAPAEYRGPFGHVKTKTDGLIFSDRLPLLAQQTDKFSVIHSMSHGQAAHERGVEYMYTGYAPSPAINYASLGSVVAHELGGRHNLPPYVTVPNTPNSFANSGFISTQFNPFSLGSDPASPDFGVRDLTAGAGAERFKRRRNILEAVNSGFGIEDDSVKALDKFYDQAYNLITSEKAQEAFILKNEDEKTREKYGTGQAGSRLLMARRLVESGVRIVKVNYGSWDNHDNIGPAMDRQLPELDKALAALFDDLSDRGMLEETLVVVTSEFGRTPRFNRNSGRDHAPRVFSSILGGGGINNGITYGSSDSLLTEVESDPVSPEDFFATIFHLAGIDHHKELMTADLRPVVISQGSVVEGLL